ncbi:hypothetical protein, partial [Pseudomonas aeruginosa]|uniref:hypothetical protein n=1 Tax=Pseudomonas aeruginosa TaxID=287 RepID=UPI001F1C6957
DGSNPSAAIVQSASDVQCSRLLKTTLVIFLSALFSKPSVVNRGTAQRMEHYPTVGIGDIFRGH